MQYNVLIGGEAGQGMDTLAVLLEKILKKQGYYVFSNKDYMSRVRGGHNFIQVRFGTEPLYSHHPLLDVVVALNKQTLEIHLERLQAKGVALYDKSIEETDARGIPLELYQVAREIGNAKVFGSVAIGAVLKLFGILPDQVESVFAERFDAATLEANLQAFQRGYELTQVQFILEKGPLTRSTLLLNSNQAIALGALAAGVGFFSGYPMTPGTSIMTYLSEKQQEAGIVVEQAEDEIAAINMAIGASYAGVRAMTGTSGGGFSLMTEALGLAAITETPLVIANIQRPGPATGLPTRTEQSDLSFILTASHGEIPRLVIAVRNPEDAFYQTARAFNLADKYQLPVILLGDQHLSDANEITPPFDFGRITIDRHLAGPEAFQETGEYQRYRLTEDGLSPRLIPGKFPGQIVLADSDEHNEAGHITESAAVRSTMMEKRMKRLDSLKEEVLEPEYFGAAQPQLLLVGWGSLYGPLREAVYLLEKQNISVGALVFGDLYPLPEKKLRHYSRLASKLVNVEQNYTGQLAKLIRQETSLAFDHSILKYDGRQLSGYEVYDKIMKGGFLHD